MNSFSYSIFVTAHNNETNNKMKDTIERKKYIKEKRKEGRGGFYNLPCCVLQIGPVNRS